MNSLNINLKIAKDTSELKLNDMTGNLTIEAALRQVKMDFEKGLNRVTALAEIIKEIEGEDN